MANQMETTISNYISDSIIDEDIGNGGCADSGYSSQGSISHVSSLNVSTLRPPVSHYLQPIYENVPINSFSTTSEFTPTSQSIRRINEFHITSPISSLKHSASSLSCTPNKIGTPKKMRNGKGRSKVHRNFIDKIHVDENSENRNIGYVEFSPIEAVNVLQERNGKFERKGSFSSTPIYEESLLKSMSVSKTDFFNSTKRPDQKSLVIRKTNSFSPRKKNWLATRSRQIPVEQAPILIENKELKCTPPVRKSVKRFLCRQNAIQTPPEPPSSNLFEITTTDCVDNDIHFESPLGFKSSSPPPSPSTETPVKKIRRNLSFNQNQSPKKELDKIIFSRIPNSPHEQRIPATKRSSTAKDAAVIAKRPQYDLSLLLPKRASYLKHFDIVSHLAETTTAIQKIFSHLGSKDIYCMHNVCQKWRAIIKNDVFACSQRNKYLSKLLKNKENLQRKPLLRSRSLIAIPKSPFPLKRANSVNVMKVPLKTSSQTSFTAETLLLINENRRLTKCPACLRPSIISKDEDNDPNNVNRIPFQKKSLFASFLKPSKYESAECTKCGYKFCMNCKCNFHGSDECPIKPYIAPMEPDDEENVKMLYPTGSQSKRNLRRLCSLDKVKFSSLGG